MRIILGLICLISLPAGAATIVVNTDDLTVVADDGLCTLTEAVDAANLNVASGLSAGECMAGDPYPAVDDITFDLGLFPGYFFPFAPFELNEPVRVIGPGADIMSLSSIANTRVFVVQNMQTNATFEISGMTFEFNHLRENFSQYGGALLVSLSAGSELLLDHLNFYQNSSEVGGGAIGIYGGNDNLITIRNSTFEANNTTNYNTTTPVGGGAIFIGANQNVVIENSSFYDNFNAHSPLTQPQSDAAGGAILVRSNQTVPTTVSIERSTFSNNHTTGVGGAIALGGPGYPSEWTQLTLKHSTLTLNQADSNDDQTGTLGSGGGLWSSSANSTNIFNSIIALNTDLSQMPDNDLNAPMNTFGYNLIGNNSGAAGTFPAGQPNPNDDWVGVPFAEIDPMLEPLSNHGGPTLSHRPEPNSIVLDQGKCNSQTMDQRHFYNSSTNFRTYDIPSINNALNGCDIGAVELSTDSSNPIPMAVNDSYNLLEDVMFTVSELNGLLANDTDNDTLIISDSGSVNVTGGDVDGLLELSANGAFQFTGTEADANGQTTFTYWATDGFNADQATVTLDILPVNDPPGFQALSTNLVSQTGIPLVITGWATHISPGPANESGQTLNFIVSVVNGPTGFFNQIPTINANNGNLTLDLQTNATGTAELNVILQDSGGTQNGGQNQSAPVTLWIQADDVIFRDGFEP